MVKFKDIIFEENVVIHCPEEWMSDVLLEYAGRKTNIFWKRFSFLGCWREYKQNTVYYIRSGVYGGINYAKENNYKVLHYNDVVIKEGEEMKTKLDYELWIKGRKADIGSELWKKNGSKIEIIGIDIDKEDEVRIMCSIKETMDLEYIGLSHIDNILFWEKPNIYQLPDIEGKLSEVKIGQEIYNNIPFEPLHITRLWNGLIECRDDKGEVRVFSPNINNRKKVPIYTTNKPKRDFSKCMDWSHAPKEAIEWRITIDGYAFWYSNAYCQRRGLDYDYDCGMYYISAGYRADLLNKNGIVEDWEYSLVKRPEGI